MFKPRLKIFLRSCPNFVKIFTVVKKDQARIFSISYMSQSPDFINILRLRPRCRRENYKGRTLVSRECCCSNRALHIPRTREIYLGEWLSNWWSMRSWRCADCVEEHTPKNPKSALRATSIHLGAIGYRHGLLGSSYHGRYSPMTE
jgi:hypothetical protein